MEEDKAGILLGSNTDTYYIPYKSISFIKIRESEDCSKARCVISYTVDVHIRGSCIVNTFTTKEEAFNFVRILRNGIQNLP